MNESRRDDIHIAVPGKRNTYTGIECCCQGIVYCNEALSLSHSLLLESDKDRTQAREGEKKSGRCALSNRRGKNPREENERQLVQFYEELFPCCILTFFFLLLLAFDETTTAINVALHRSYSQSENDIRFFWSP